MHSQNGCHHHLSSQAVSMSCFYCWGGGGGGESGFNHWQVCLTQASFKLLSLHWNLEQVKFCIRRLRLESLFPIALKFSCVQAPMALNSRFLGCSSFQCKAPRVETPDVGLRCFSPYGEPLQLWLHSHLWVACLKESMDLDNTISVPPSLWFFYIFSCGRSFLLV